jgi:hypothetical protein
MSALRTGPAQRREKRAPNPLEPRASVANRNVSARMSQTQARRV